MYRGRLRNNSGLSNGGNGPRQRWPGGIGRGDPFSSTPKGNCSDMVSVGDDGGGSTNDQLELYSPSTISNVSPGFHKFRYSDKYAYKFDNAYEAVYAEKVVVHTVENILSKEPTPAAPFGLFRSQGRRRQWWPWILFPLLLLLPLIWFGASDNMRKSLCPYFGALPLPGSTTNRTLEIVTLKKFYHYFVPSNQLGSGTNGSGNFDSEILNNFENELTALNTRLEILEKAIKRFNATAASPLSGQNFTKEIHSLRALFTQMDQRIDDLELAAISSTGSNRKSINDEVMVIQAHLARLQENLASIERERKSWREQLNDIVAKNRQQHLELIDINSRLDSITRADCDCSSALVPTGGITRIDVDRLITEAIRRYDADKTGLPDFASEPGGGSVLSTRCTDAYSSNTRRHSIFGIPIPFFPRDYSPRVVIQPGVVPGECWAFKGARGYLVIKLNGLIQVTAVSYEHIPKEISPDGHIYSAPKNMEIVALKTEKDENGTTLGNFTYDADGPPLQYFPVQATNAAPTEILELKVTNNHGHPVYTCLYRLRVHGKRVNPGWPHFGGSP